MPRTPAPLTVERFGYDWFIKTGPHGKVIASFTEEADARAFVALPALIQAIKALRYGHHSTGCWCQLAIGNPMYTDHSETCRFVQAALAQADGPSQEQG